MAILVEDAIELKEVALMERTERFSTHLLDRALVREREGREQQRHKQIAAVLKALDALSHRISFEQAYIFGSLAKPYRYFEDSDVDIAFVGLKDQDFFQTIAFLSGELDREVDVLQLEDHPLRDKVMREGIKWKKGG
jgi:predicted nucleotidyltransferase